MVHKAQNRAAVANSMFAGQHYAAAPGRSKPSNRSRHLALPFSPEIGARDKIFYEPLWQHVETW